MNKLYDDILHKCSKCKSKSWMTKEQGKMYCGKCGEELPWYRQRMYNMSPLEIQEQIRKNSKNDNGIVGLPI